MGALKGNRNAAGAHRGAAGNQSALIHGGEGAIVRLRQGQEFLGVALEVQRQTVADSGVDLDALSGIERMLTERGLRFEAVARLFDLAALSAAESGDLDRWEKYQQRAGWIGSKSFAALLEVKKLLAARDAGTLEMMLSKKAGGDGKDVE